MKLNLLEEKTLINKIIMGILNSKLIYNSHRPQQRNHIYVYTDLNRGEGFTTVQEYQILNDEHHPDTKLDNHEGS
ncbi:MAG: hypothetical protein B7Z06_07815 [Flavobacteriales bacterium 32-35-8]|nr:MAG: hypothetical protein B7Z06_07815 [Flavobacteriales bacterium 32-35-8]